MDNPSKSIQSEMALNTFRLSEMQKKILYIIDKLYSTHQIWVIKEEIIIPLFGSDVFTQPKNPNNIRHQRLIKIYGKVKPNIKNSVNRSLATLYNNGFIKRQDTGEYSQMGYFYLNDTTPKREGFRYVFALSEKGSEKLGDLKARNFYD